MSFNTGFFAAYNHRNKPSMVSYRLPLNNQQHHHASLMKSTRSSMDNPQVNESFLPSINGNNDGHRPYRRNDFANNHLFVAKQKLARFFVDQPVTDSQGKSDLIHLFDQQEPKHKNRRRYKHKPQVEILSVRKKDVICF